jgi:hypothetical protein
MPLKCSVTGESIIHSSVSYLLVGGSTPGTCVSDKALKQMGIESVTSGGRMVKLCPSEDEIRGIWEDEEKRRGEEKERKRKKKEGKKEGKKRKGEGEQKNKRKGEGEDEGKVKKAKTTAAAGQTVAKAAENMAKAKGGTKSEAVRSMFHDSGDRKDRTSGNDLFACSGGRRY